MPIINEWLEEDLKPVYSGTLWNSFVKKMGVMRVCQISGLSSLPAHL